MAVSLHIPIEDYLANNYRPDREFVDGELPERNVGKWEHARASGFWLLVFSLMKGNGVSLAARNSVYG